MVNVGVGQKMAAKGADVVHLRKHPLRQFALNAEAELFGIGNLQVWVDGAERAPRGADRRASGDVAEIAVLVLDASDIGRIVERGHGGGALHAVVEQASAGADDGFRIDGKGEAYARAPGILAREEPSWSAGRYAENRRIRGVRNQISLGGIDAVADALQSVVDIAAAGNDLARRSELHGLGGIVERRHEIRQIIDRGVLRHHVLVTDAEVDGQLARHLPGIVDERGGFGVAIAADGFVGGFGVALKVAEKGVRQRVAGTVGIAAGVEDDVAIVVRPAILVLAVANHRRADFDGVLPAHE